MVKEGKAVVPEKSEMTLLFTNTTCSREGGTSTWEAMYNILEEEQPRIPETKVTVDSCDSSNASMFETTCSFLHHLDVRPKIIPYTYMVKWVTDEVDILDRELRTISQEVMGSFMPKNLGLMYHLWETQVINNKQLVEKFSKENKDPANCTRNWSNNEGKI